MMTNHVLTCIIVLLFLALVGVSITLGIYMKKYGYNKEGLCLCRGPGVAECVNRDEQMRKYNAGLTEYSNFDKPPDYLYKAVDPPYM